MKNCFAIAFDKSRFLIFIIFLCQQVYGQTYKKIHDEAIVIDTHNDFLMQVTDSNLQVNNNNGIAYDKNLKGITHSDLYRQKQGGLDVQVFSIYCNGEMENPYDFANREIDSLDAFIARNPNKIVKAYNSKTLLEAIKQKKLVAMLGVEGGHMIENDLNKLEKLYNRGVRYLTLTWNNSTPWATSAFDENSNKNLTRKGLSDFGIKVVNKMNELGMLIDVSHVGEQTFWDVIKYTTKPIIASHSSVYNLSNHPRNLKDDQIKAIAKNGGVIQINFNPPFIDSTFARKESLFSEKHQIEKDSLENLGMDDWAIENYLCSKYKGEINAMKPPFNLVIQHIDYVVKLVGADYVGLGSDFDGINYTPQQLDDVSKFPLITKALLEKGYSQKDIKKILGGNFLRVLKANENVSP